MSGIQQGLLITAIGMGLVFVVIVFLWGLMALLVRVTSKNETPLEEAPELPQSDNPVVPELLISEGQRRAAAAAAAVALAIDSFPPVRSKALTPDQTQGLSPWQSFHRTHQYKVK